MRLNTPFNTSSGSNLSDTPVTGATGVIFGTLMVLLPSSVALPSVVPVVLPVSLLSGVSLPVPASARAGFGAVEDEPASTSCKIRRLPSPIIAGGLTTVISTSTSLTLVKGRTSVMVSAICYCSFSFPLALITSLSPASLSCTVLISVSG